MDDCAKKGLMYNHATGRCITQKTYNKKMRKQGEFPPCPPGSFRNELTLKCNKIKVKVANLKKKATDAKKKLNETEKKLAKNQQKLDKLEKRLKASK